MKQVFAIFLVFVLFFCSCSKGQEKQGDGSEKEEAVDTLPTGQTPFSASTPANLKAVWLSQWDMQRVYVKAGKQREKEDFREHAKEIFLNASLDGFNTVFVQVRPFGDSFYPSEYYPPSKMVVGAYGNTFSYDPFEILVEEAHANGLSVHAWINPLRLVSDAEITQIGQEYAVRQWYEDGFKRGKYLVLQGDGRWYLNPGYQEVRDLIVSGAREVMERYEVDGLHMDDYFYPTTVKEYDAACFAEYQKSGGKLTLDDFRRNSVSLLLKELYRTVHAARKGAVFGVAPSGNMESAYATQYADVYTWCENEGYLDYICPQIYFGFEHEKYPFDKTVNRWAEMSRHASVKLYIGISFHKASSGYDQYAGSGAYEWAEHTDVLKRSLEHVCKVPACSGVSVFSYQYFRNALTGEAPDFPKQERENFLPLWKTALFPAAKS